MPSDFDWIFKRDPFWRERPKEEALAVQPGPTPLEQEGRGRDSSRDDQGASTANEP
jgi:hypothetical protein